MDVALRLGGEKIFVWLVVFLGLTAAIVFGFLVGEDPITTITILASGVAALLWIALVRKHWWLIVPGAAGLGGYFYYGYKVYPHELALLAAFVPLGLAIAVRHSGTAQKRTSHFPFTMYLLSFYLIAHWVGSNIYNKIDGQGGFGNVSRAYFNALWVIIFAIAFWRYGSTKYVRLAFFVSYLSGFARLFIGLLTYFSRTFAYLPVINYVLPGSTGGGADLRYSALTLGMFSACYFLIHKGFMRKAFHASVFFASFFALLFGAGRGVLVIFLLIPFSLGLLYRKVVALLLMSLVILTFVTALNLAPTLIDRAPYAMQRSLSVLILDPDEANSYGRTATSDIWHRELRELGFKNWTQSWHTFIFGTGIRPFDNAMNDTRRGGTTFEDLLASSSKVGAYESGWWTVTAVTGTVGLVCYLLVFTYLLRRLVPILWKEKIADHRHAFAFMGVFGIITWLGLGWGTGSYPTTEIMFSFIALCAFQDRRETAKAERRPMETALPAHRRPSGRSRMLQPMAR